MGIDIDKIARDFYYKQPDLVRFLLAENLALKMVLHDKGLLKPEEFKEYQLKAEETLQQKVDRHVAEWKKANPETVRLLKETEQAIQSEAQGQPPAAS